RRRIAGRVDDDVDLGRRDERTRIVGDVSGTGAPGFGERPRGEALRTPAGACQCGAGAIGREVGDADDVDARRVLRLREVHRAEFAGADQADFERPARGRACKEQAMEIQGTILEPALIYPPRATLRAAPPRGRVP